MKCLRIGALLPFFILVAVAASAATTITYHVVSPDNKTDVQIDTKGTITISILYNKKEVIAPSPVWMELDQQRILGRDVSVRSTETRSISENITPVVPEKRKVVPNVCNELTLHFAGDFGLNVRAYNDGAAYRFFTMLPGEITITHEEAELHFSPSDSVYFPQEDSFLSHSERQYPCLSVKQIADTQMCCLPALFIKENGIKVAFTEADLLDYAGLYLKGTGPGKTIFHTISPPYPLEEEALNDRTVRVKKGADYIARTKGTREFPWRVFLIAERDGDLVENDLVYRLGSPQKLQETDWIKPGKVAWDWWNANNIVGVKFQSGVNTDTYKYYIDFASRYGIEYIILDEGWSKPSDLFQINPAMNMDTLFAYARRKNVGIIPWVTWKALDEQMTKALDQFAAWGAKGIKVDFMQRDDQKMVNYYERVAVEAAKRHLLVDFHGAYKPTGLNRTYPNVVTREGVRGLEWNKWSSDITPEHDVTLPFTRMLAGAMDFTPGAMINAVKDNFHPIFTQPMSQGTRCHQLAMYVVYESPLQMLADCPSNYLKEPDAMDFLGTVPTTWDETKVLDAKVADFITVARKHGNDWYIGSMTDWTPRDIQVDLRFLGQEKFQLVQWADGVNADRNAMDFAKETKTITSADRLTVHLAPGGGWVARIRKIEWTMLVTALVVMLCIPGALLAQTESKQQHDARMQWWRDARFGLFIHWGLYSVPAGEWKGQTNHAEWIRTTAQIPIKEYEKFVPQFNPVKFNADEWVRMAKAAGMKYIVITSKHHDGFCLFNTKQTDFAVMSTPFKRDIMKELSDACHKQGMTICWYHSIMDWHHPDYLPRRDWEKDRSTEGANFDHYVQYMKAELKELLTNYGPIGVLWFDGEWESTWNQERGRDLYAYIRSLQPNIIINNRVGAGRSGMEGFTTEGAFGADFGTPEQQIPATGLPGVDWETCMTMNDHWGYNKNDHNWKSAEELLHNLADIASKGGNFLLNIGPTAEGLFPPESIERLHAIGEWMNMNGEAIYGTSASPFKQLSWGRCTRREFDAGTRLYLHVFQWPANGKLVVPGIYNDVKIGYLLADKSKKPLAVNRREDALVVDVPAKAPTLYNSVVVINLKGKVDVNDPPEITSSADIFLDSLKVSVASNRSNIEVRYTLDGTAPSISSVLAKGPVTLTNTATIKARCFREGKAVSGISEGTFSKVTPRPAEAGIVATSGVKFAYCEGVWDSLPDFNTLKPKKEGVAPQFTLSPKLDNDHFGFEYDGYIKVPEQGVYVFYTESDDGSRLYIGDSLVVDNNGLHGMGEKKGLIPLAAGLQPIRVLFFEKDGSEGLRVLYEGPGFKKQEIPDSVLYH
jgi:alpha-L-fucosidase